MASLTGRLAFLIRVNRKSRMTARSDKGDYQGTEQCSNSPFSRMPPELILCVADHLGPVAQVLLSLADKRIHGVLNERLNLSLRDSTRFRNRFLNYLERDLPDYLTCKECGMLYKWRSRRSRGWLARWRNKTRCSFTCPRAQHHSQMKMYRDYSNVMYTSRTSYIHINPSVVCLIVRGHARGLDHGLPAPFLNGFYKDHNGVSHELEGRVVKSHFILHSHFEMSIPSGKGYCEMIQFVDDAICHHHGDLWEAIMRRPHIDWRPTKEENVQDLPISKCSWCPTDFRLYLREVLDDSAYIVVDKWQDFGPGDSTKKAFQEMYGRSTYDQALDTSSTAELSPHRLARRDIRSQFLSQVA